MEGTGRDLIGVKPSREEGMALMVLLLVYFCLSLFYGSLSTVRESQLKVEWIHLREGTHL